MQIMLTIIFFVKSCNIVTYSLSHLIEDKPLFQQSTRIISISTDRELPRPNYFWLSSRSVLLWRAKTHDPLVLLDIITRKQTPMRRLGHIIQRERVHLDTVSPNGKWVLCSAPDFSNAFVAIRLDGTQIIKRPVREGYAVANAAWMRDSHHWTFLGLESYKLYGVVQSLDRPGIVRKVKLGILAGFHPAGNDVFGYILGPLENQNVLAYGEASTWWSAGIHADTNLGYFCSFDIGKRQLPLKTFTLQAPFGDDVHFVCLSPDGKQLALIVCKARFEKESMVYNAIEIQTCRLDGHEKRIAGRLEFPDSQVLPALPYGLRWLPDNKHLSYIYKDVLWTIPTE